MTGPRIVTFKSSLSDEDVDLSWQEDPDRHCADIGPAVFFPSDPGGQHAVDYVSKKQAAKNLCDGCPVRRQCLDHAVRFNEIGIWGGTDDKERRTIRREIRQGADQTRGAA